MSEAIAKRRRNRKINNTLLVILLIMPLAVILAFIMNIIRVHSAETGSGETIVDNEEDTIKNEYTNAYYSIGYNATEISKTYFRELDSAIESGDKQAIASAVVKCFVTEYYTWTNKDGNYDIGGMQYIFTDKRSDFETYTRFNFYADMDLYLTQYGRDKLIEVSDVTVNSAGPSGSLEIVYDEDTESEHTEAFECYDVDAGWNYVTESVMNTSGIQKHALFRVVDHGGRMEIAAINYTEPETWEDTDYGY